MRYRCYECGEEYTSEEPLSRCEECWCALQRLGIEGGELERIEDTEEVE